MERNLDKEMKGLILWNLLSLAFLAVTFLTHKYRLFGARCDVRIAGFVLFFTMSSYSLGIFIRFRQKKKRKKSLERDPG